MTSLRAFRPFFNALNAFEHQLSNPALMWEPSNKLLGALTSAGYPPVTIQEKGKGFELIADLPGVKKEDLKVSLGDGNTQLVLEGKMVLKESADAADDKLPSSTTDQVTGETAITKSNDQKHLLVDERSFRQVFHRAFHFSTALDPQSVKAKLDEGVLKLTIDKKEGDAGVSVINVE